MNPSSSLILIDSLAVTCHIGVPEEERSQPQTLWLDVEVELLTPFSQMRDDIQETLDYAALASELEDLAGVRPRQLIETLAADCVRHLLAYPTIRRARVCVRKKILPSTRFVAAVCEETKLA